MASHYAPRSPHIKRNPSSLGENSNLRTQGGFLFPFLRYTCIHDHFSVTDGRSLSFESSIFIRGPCLCFGAIAASCIFPCIIACFRDSAATFYELCGLRIVFVTIVVSLSVSILAAHSFLFRSLKEVCGSNRR